MRDRIRALLWVLASFAAILQWLYPSAETGVMTAGLALPLIGLGSSIFGGIMAGRGQAQRNAYLRQLMEYLKQKQGAQEEYLKGRSGEMTGYYTPQIGAAGEQFQGSRGKAAEAFGNIYENAGFTPEEQKALLYSEGGKNLYLSPEEQARIDYGPERQALVRRAATAPFGRIVEQMGQRGTQAAATRGNYMPGWNATMRDIADQAARGEGESGLNAELGVQDRAQQAARYLAESRQGTLRDIEQNRIAATGEVQARRAQGQQAGAAGLGQLAGLDLSRLSDVERQRLQSELGFGGLLNQNLIGMSGDITRVGTGQASQPSPWEAGLSTFQGSGGLSWFPPSPGRMSGSPATAPGMGVGQTGGLGPPAGGVLGGWPGASGPAGQNTYLTPQSEREQPTSWSSGWTAPGTRRTRPSRMFGIPSGQQPQTGYMRPAYA